MIEFVLKGLEYGVLGLCAVTLVLVAGIIRTEQKLDKQPRKSILQASYVFMAFSISLALIIGYVQLQEQGASAEQSAAVQRDLEAAQGELRVAEDKLLAIRSAAGPILDARSNIVERLPAGPSREALSDLIGALKRTLRED